MPGLRGDGQGGSPRLPLLRLSLRERNRPTPAAVADFRRARWFTLSRARTRCGNAVVAAAAGTRGPRTCGCRELRSGSIARAGTAGRDSCRAREADTLFGARLCCVSRARANTRARRIWQGPSPAVHAPRVELALTPSAKGLPQREPGRCRSLSTTQWATATPRGEPPAAASTRRSGSTRGSIRRAGRDARSCSAAAPRPAAAS
jgi:hypothetical protein